MIIHLVGPGGAGKSTIGAATAARLDLPFLDLDSEFMTRLGDISQVIDREGYDAYARKNFKTYLAIADPNAATVIALSSGFMVYPEGVHPLYQRIRSGIARSQSTLVLLPSLDLERCVRETVRRQLRRPFTRSASREELVIRERYSIYMALPAVRVETMGLIDEIVEHIVATLPALVVMADASTPEHLTPELRPSRDARHGPCRSRRSGQSARPYGVNRDLARRLVGWEPAIQGTNSG